MRIPLAGTAYLPRTSVAGVQDSVNVFSELVDDPTERAKGIGAVYLIPGRHLMKATGRLAVRGFWSGGGRLFVFHDANHAGGANSMVVEYNSTGGVVATYVMPAAFVWGGQPVQIHSNGPQLLIVTSDENATGGFAYYLTGGGAITRCATRAYAGFVACAGGVDVAWVSGDLFLDDGSWSGTAIVIGGVGYTIASVTVGVGGISLKLTGAGPVTLVAAYTHAGDPVSSITGAVLNGYGIVQRPPTVGKDYGRQINVSSFLDFSTWDGLDYERKDSSPDNLQCIFVNNEQLFLWGTKTYEIWQAAGGFTQTGLAAFPFQRIPGATGKKGHPSRWADSASDHDLFSLCNDENGGVFATQTSGLIPIRISTKTQESAWNRMDMSHAISYCEQHAGHTFWVINSGTVTWAYDASEKMWGTRYAWTGSAFSAYHTAYHIYIPEWTSDSTGTVPGMGRHITAGPGYGITENGNLYEQHLDFYDDVGADIKWQKTLPYIYTDGSRNFIGRMEMELETGTVASGAAPNIVREYSDDRGHTFGNAEPASIGVHDDFSLKVFWPNGGSSPNRVYRFSGIGKSKVALVDLNVDIHEGMAP